MKQNLPILTYSSAVRGSSKMKFKTHASTKSLSELRKNENSMRNSTNLSKINNRGSQQNITISDISYNQPIIKTEMNLSTIMNDPKQYELKNRSKKSNNMYTTMYKLSFKKSFKNDLSDDAQSNKKGITGFQEVRMSQLQKYLKKIVIENSSQIEQSAVPPNRQQALDLSEWYQLMVEQARQNINYNGQQLADKLQLIYSTCIKEIVRQISIECRERGELLQEVWNSYIQLIEGLLLSFQENQKNSDHYLKLMQEKLNIEKQLQLQKNSNTSAQTQITELQSDVQQQIEEKSQLKQKINVFKAEVQSQTQKITKLEESNKKLQAELQIMKLQKESDMEEERIKLLIPEGKSLVSHLLEAKNMSMNKIKRQSTFTRFNESESKDEVNGIPQISVSHFESDLTPIKPLRNDRKMKSNVYNPNILVDECQTQTDEVPYSKIPIINELIKSLITGEFEEAVTSINKNIYEKSIETLSSRQSLNQEEIDQILGTIQNAQVQMNTFTQLQHSVTEMQQQQEQIKKKNVQQMLELKEQKANSKYLDEVLHDATQQFLSLLKDKNKKIKDLKKSNTKLLSKLSSFSNSDQLQSISPSKKTPQFQKIFNFKMEDMKIDEAETPMSQKSENLPNSHRDNSVSSKSQTSQIQEDSEEENEEQQVVDFLEDPQINQTSKDDSDNYNASNDQVEESGIQKNDKIKSLIKKYGIVRQGSKRFTKVSNIKLQFITQLKKEKKVKRVYSQNQEAAGQLLNDLIASKSKQLKDAIIPISSINKIVHIIFMEAIKNPEGFKVPMHVSIYDFFLKKYGFKNVAEKKIKQLLQFIYHKRNQYPKLALLSRLCYMDGQMDEAAYKLVLESQKYLQNKEISFQRSEVSLSFDEIQDYSTNFLIAWLGNQHVQFFLNQVKMFQNKTIIFESAMIQIINLYFSKKQDCELNLKLLFQAADLDGNKLIEFSEFKTLYKAIHPQNFNKSIVLQQFLEYADYIEQSTKDKMITLPRFAEIAIELNLFSNELIHQYSQGANQLFQQWEQEQDVIKYRYLQSEKFSTVSYTYNLLMEQIELLKKNETTPYDLETLWVSFRLLNERSKRVILNYETKECLLQILPIQTLFIQQTYRQIEEMSI